MAPASPRGFLLILVLFAGAFLGCSEAPPEAPASRVVPVATRDIVVAATAAGVVEPVTTIEVKSKASGEIIAVHVEEGDQVRAGQLLVQVDPRIPANAVVQAEADSQVARAELDNALAQLERAQKLLEARAITDLEFETAKLAHASANAALIRTRRALEDAKIAFEDTEVRAPSSGAILGRAVEVGSVIASASRDVGGGAVLLRMATLDTVQVRALVDETDIGQIRPDMPVSIRVAAFPNRPFSGKVGRIGTEAIVQQNVTMFPVLILIQNSERLLRPGMNAEVEVRVGAARGVLAVPNAALRTREEIAVAATALGLSLEAIDRELGRSPIDSVGEAPDPAGEYLVFVLRNGGPQVAPVRAGLTDFDYTAIVQGLRSTDSVYLLPTAGLLEEQARRRGWIQERVGGPLPRGGTR
jgi:HlyD family secretion protein